MAKRKAPTLVDQELARFLVDLAIDENLRQAFSTDAEGVLAGTNLSEAAKQAILARSGREVLDALQTSTQFNQTARPKKVKRPAAPGKKKQQKPAKRKKQTRKSAAATPKGARKKRRKP